MNQFSQKGFVRLKFVRQSHGLEGSVGGGGSSYRREGTETRAEVLFRMVRERVLFLFVVRVFCFLFCSHM